MALKTTIILKTSLCEINVLSADSCTLRQYILHAHFRHDISNKFINITKYNSISKNTLKQT